LAEYADPALDADRYGAGEIVERFERRIAAELGKEAAVLMPSGTMAQQIALRIWCDRRGIETFAYHPLSHLNLHEAQAFAMLHGLRALHAGGPTRLMQLADLEAIADPLAALLVELPQRDLGGQLPAWDELTALCDLARKRGTRLHLDGARLWESAPHYGRSHAEIAALFDSVYVSFYKGLGAIAGSALAGDADFIAEARVWQHRHGGRLVSIYPLALSAQRGFERQLPKMAAWRERARTIAPLLDEIRGVIVVPNPPHTNMFHLFIHGEAEELEARAHAIARERGIWVFARLAPTVMPVVWKWEFVVGDATADVSDDEIVAIVREIVA
jgi:threonine aldolase